MMTTLEPSVATSLAELVINQALGLMADTHAEVSDIESIIPGPLEDSIAVFDAARDLSRMWTSREFAALRAAYRVSTDVLAARLDVRRRTVNRWLAADPSTPLVRQQNALDELLRQGGAAVWARFVRNLTEAPADDTTGGPSVTFEASDQ